EMFLPETIAEHDNVRTSGPIFLRRENTAQHWRDAKRLEKAFTYRGRLDLLWLRNSRQREAPKAVDRHVPKNLIVAFPIEIVRCGDRELIHSGEAFGRRGVPHAYNPIRIFERQGAEQYRIYHAEDGCVSADPQRKHQHRKHRESWPGFECPHSVS